MTGERTLDLPSIGLGCAALGRPEVPDETAEATLASALAAGIDYLDTAPLYGCGLSERRVGRALARHVGKRPKLSTKIGHVIDMPEGSHMPPSKRRTDFSAASVHRSLEQSLERLDVGQIDLVYLHDPGPDPTRLDAAVAALDALRGQGLLGAIGVGTGSVQAALAAVRRFPIDAVLIAGRLTLLDREAEAELLDVCATRGTRLVAGGVFNSGILAADDPSGANYDYAKADARQVAIARDLARACERFNVKLIEAAIQFAARHGAVSTTLLGAASPGELAQCLAAFERKIPQALWLELDKAIARNAV